MDLLECYKSWFGSIRSRDKSLENRKDASSKPLSFKVVAPGRGKKGCTEGRTAIWEELGQCQSPAHQENLCGRPGSERG